MWDVNKLPICSVRSFGWVAAGIVSNTGYCECHYALTSDFCFSVLFEFCLFGQFIFQLPFNNKGRTVVSIAFKKCFWKFRGKLSGSPSGCGPGEAFFKSCILNLRHTEELTTVRTLCPKETLYWVKIYFTVSVRDAHWFFSKLKFSLNHWKRSNTIPNCNDDECKVPLIAPKLWCHRYTFSPSVENKGTY